MEPESLPVGIEPEWITVSQTRRVTNLGKTKIFELIAAGTFESIKVGKKRLIRLRSARNLGGKAA
jgi:excisionase family DNA binding protein